MTLAHHPSAAPIFRDAQNRLDLALSRDDFSERVTQLETYLVAPGAVNPRICLELGRLGTLCGAAAVAYYAQGQVSQFADQFCRAVGYKSLDVRLQCALSATIPDRPDARPVQFLTGLDATGPIVLSQWARAQLTVAAYLWLVAKDQRLRDPATRRITNGTIDAFLINLFANAFDHPMSYTPQDMIEPCYADLLQHWRTTDKTTFQRAMADAIDFHIRRSRESTDHVDFEFSFLFEQAFALELLAVLALRQRLGLPQFPTNHAYLDGPWSVIQSFPAPTRDPLIDQIETRLRKDFPTFE